MKKKIISIICLFVMLSSFVVPTTATEPLPGPADGKTAVGIVNLDEHSPIVMEKRTITFDIQELPSSIAEYVEGRFSTEKSRLKVKYQVYNPTDGEITLRLALPITTSYYDYTMEDRSEYHVTVNGEEPELTLRHSLHHKDAEFDMEYDPGRLMDEYAEHKFITPETTVTKYTYRISGVDLKEYPLARVGADIYSYSFSDAYVYLAEGGSWNNHGSGYRIHRYIGNDDTLELYVFGSPSSNRLPTWKIYQNPKVSDKEMTTGSVELIKTEQMSFNDYVFADYDKSLGISEMDWYNAFIKQIEYLVVPIVQFFSTGVSKDGEMSDYFMEWYRYDIVLAPGERAVTEIDIPIHPEIDRYFSPLKHTFLFNNSRHDPWSISGETEIIVKTPFYAIESYSGEIVKTEDGYKIEPGEQHYTGYSVTLCEAENPEPHPHKEYMGSNASGFNFWQTLLLIITFPIRLIVDLWNMLF